jgi:stearoyl-CoA desaturase (delta-9 desaturase)
VALLTFGEGWHNNHHAHPTSARHGLAWYEFDLTWLQIKLLQMLGIAERVRIVDVNGRQPGRQTQKAA